MIAYLEGKVLNLTKEKLLLLTGTGVGYQVFITSFSYTAIDKKTRCSIWIYTCVREDSITLYGFVDLKEKAVFENLISVDRLGPKMAIKLLSASPFDVIIGMIEKGDVNGLAGLPGIGKKKAEQIVWKLKGSLNIDVELKPLDLKKKTAITSALVNLGFKPSDVDSFVSGLNDDFSVEEAIKKGISTLSEH